MASRRGSESCLELRLAPAIQQQIEQLGEAADVTERQLRPIAALPRTSTQLEAFDDLQTVSANRFAVLMFGSPTHTLRATPSRWEPRIGPERSTAGSRISSIGIVFVWGATGLISNGGFRRLWSVWSEPSEETVAAYEAIGAGEAVALLRQSLSVFPGGVFPENPIADVDALPKTEREKKAEETRALLARSLPGVEVT